MAAFDLGAYGARIGYDGPREPTLAVLRAICAAHPAALPFENIDPLLGRPPELASSALVAPLVAQRRGGYCYEHNALLRLALLALGMDVTSLAARVAWMSAPDAPRRAPSHMLLRVVLPGEPDNPWLVDAGFGGHLLAAPLRWVSDLPQDTPGGRQRLVQEGADWRLDAEIAGTWTPVYRSTLAPLLPVDYEPLNWYTATHPASIFRHNLLLERLTPQGRASLLNDRYTYRPTHGDGSASTRRLTDAADFEQVLTTAFAITPPVAASTLWGRVPQGLDGLFIPEAH